MSTRKKSTNKNDVKYTVVLNPTIVTIMDQYTIVRDVEVSTEYAGNALNRLNGKDMSWSAYNFIVDNILRLDALCASMVKD